MTKRKSTTLTAERVEWPEMPGVVLERASTGMAREQVFGIDFSVASVEDQKSAVGHLAKALEAHPTRTLPDRLDEIEQYAKALDRHPCAYIRRAAKSVAMNANLVRVLDARSDPATAWHALDLGEMFAHLVLRANHEETVRAAKRASAGRGKSLRKYPKETIQHAVMAYREALAETPDSKRTALQRRVAKRYGISERTLRRHM